MIKAIVDYTKNYKRQMFRFVLVGVVTFLINNFFFWIFYSCFNLYYQVSASLAYCLTVICHFFLNRGFSYGHRTMTGIYGSIPKYLGMLLLNYLIVLTVVLTTVEVFRLSPFFGILFSTAFTGCSSFLIMNHFVFKKRA